jgi:hypothetical protein
MYFRYRIQVDQRGPRDAAETIGREALFQFVQRGVHPVSTAVGNQARFRRGRRRWVVQFGDSHETVYAAERKPAAR